MTTTSRCLGRGDGLELERGVELELERGVELELERGVELELERGVASWKRRVERKVGIRLGVD